MHKLEITGVVVIDADCFIEEGFQVSGKLLSLMGLDHVPVGRSSLKGLHPFPKEWRKDAVNMNDLPCLNSGDLKNRWNANKRHAVDVSGEQLLADLVMHGEGKTTIAVTGPLSNVAWCIAKYGNAFTSKVEEVVIMGGAVDVIGNVFKTVEPNCDETPEWNFYWDAPAAKTVLSCPTLKNVLFSLDSTNSVPVLSDFVQRFGEHNKYLLSQFVGSSWAMCTHFGQVYESDRARYYAWDALTAAFVVDPSLVELEAVLLDVVVGSVPSEGRTVRVKEEEKSSGRALTLVARNPNAEKFYNMVLECCCHGPTM